MPDPDRPLDEAERKRLNERYAELDGELERLKDLPVGDHDPAMREAQIYWEQDEIEGALGEDWYKRRKLEDHGPRD